VIPKIIHQTVSNKAALHPVLRENIQRLKAMNPDWEHRLYDDAECRAFVATHCNAHTLGLYDRISPRYGAAKADFFRYLALYHVGGVYLDIKSTVVQPLSMVFSADTRFLISYWDNEVGGRDKGAGKHPKYGVDSEIQQWFIVAELTHPFLEAVIKRVSHNILHYDALHGGVGASGVLRTTGPIAFTLAIQPILDQFPHERVDIHDLGFRYTCMANDPLQDQHRKIIPSYRSIRFPVVEVSSNDPPKVHVWYWLAVLVAYLHEATKVGGLRQRLDEIKKMRRKLRESQVPPA